MAPVDGKIHATSVDKQLQVYVPACSRNVVSVEETKASVVGRRRCGASHTSAHSTRLPACTRCTSPPQRKILRISTICDVEAASEQAGICRQGSLAGAVNAGIGHASHCSAPVRSLTSARARAFVERAVAGSHHLKIAVHAWWRQQCRAWWE